MPAPALLARALFAAGLTAAAAGGPARAADPVIAYTVTPEASGGALQDLRVSLSFTVDHGGHARVRLPSSWSGARELWRAIGDIEAQGARLQRPSPAELVLTAAPDARVTLSYRLRQDFAGEMSTAVGSPFRPITRPGWFTAVGWATFAEVEGRLADPVSFRWGAAPAGWTLASSLDAPKARQIDALHDSVLVGGVDLKVVERPADGGRVRVAMHGAWRVSPAELAELQARIATASGAFWKAHGEDMFVAVTPLQAPPGQTAEFGVNLGDAFALWATGEVDAASLRHILAHEHQHVWLPTRVGSVRSGADEPLDYWLSEGFTDFYTLRILLRAGVYSLEDFVADENRILAAYAASPVREAPNALVRTRFWSDRAVADLPYQRGLMLAALWDDRLRRKSGGKAGLDDVVLGMKALTERDGAAATPPLAQDNLKTAYARLGGGDLSSDFARFVEGGQRVLLPADLYAGCARIQTFTAPADASEGELVHATPTPGARLESAAGPLRDLASGRPTMLLQKITLEPGMSPETRARCTALMAGELKGPNAPAG